MPDSFSFPEQLEVLDREASQVSSHAASLTDILTTQCPEQGELSFIPGIEDCLSFRPEVQQVSGFAHYQTRYRLNFV